MDEDWQPSSVCYGVGRNVHPADLSHAAESLHVALLGHILRDYLQHF